MKVTVTDAALRQLVHEAMEGENSLKGVAPEKQPVQVNAGVDPSAAVTDPADPNYVPQNRVEFGVAIKDRIKAIPNDKMPALFKSVADAIDSVPELTDKKEDAVKDANDKTLKTTEDNSKKVEEAVRLMVRTAITEADLRDPADVQADAEEMGHAAATGGKRAYKSTAIGGMHDVGGSSFEEIAKELGFSVAGAKQAVDKALLKARQFAEMDEDDRDIFVLTAMKDYITMLAETGELTPADVQLMMDHPDVVRELDGFREYLDKVFRRARRHGELPTEAEED